MDTDLESRIQDRLENRLKKRGWLVTKVNLCAMAGWPDLICIRNGKVVFVEVKRPGEYPSRLQLWCHGMIQSHGGTVVVYSGGELPPPLQDPKPSQDD